jgi:uncharacterized protein YbbK (DUF523 family)/uncharacterized protein YbgA (DUF1722 family)
MKPRSASPIRIGISSCLLGQAVRYDGGHKLDAFLIGTLGAFVEWVPVCPEVECGLPVPREPMRLVEASKGLRLMTVRSGVDHTERMAIWTRKKLRELDRLDLSGFVFKSRSPSSGLRGAKIFSSRGRPLGTGPGLFARAVTDRFPLIPLEDEERLQSEARRSGFIERVFVYRRWRDFLRSDGTRAGLAVFHEDHRLLIMAHGPGNYIRLEVLLRAPTRVGRRSLLDRYGSLLMEGLRSEATPAKITAVLRHAALQLRPQLSKEERNDLRHAIERHREGRLPLIVPLTLLIHHARRLGTTGLTRQHFLDPDPRELILRYHA